MPAVYAARDVAPSFARIAPAEITIGRTPPPRLAPAEANMFDWNYWLELFEERARNLVIRRPPPEDRLSDAERARIGNSLGTFQLGE